MRKNSEFLSFFQSSQSQPELDQNVQFFNEFYDFLNSQKINMLKKTSFSRNFIHFLAAIEREMSFSRNSLSIREHKKV